MPDSLTIEKLVAATAARQIYRAQRGEADWTLVLLTQASTSPAGWAARLSELAAQASKIRAVGCVPIEQSGTVDGVAAVGRPWLAGHSARALGRGKGDGLPPLLVLLAAVDLAAALERLHGAGLCQGSASPESAWVGSDGRLVFVEVGVEPALSGRAADPASDVQSLGRTLYAWLTGREANLDPREPVPTDFALPSRLDRRVPALADALILRALQAGGPRGLKSAGEMVVGLRQVLRSAGAAVSPGEVASWVQKRAGAGAIDSGVSALLAVGKRVELAAGSERRPAVRVADTLVDFAVPAESVPAPSRMPRAEAAPAIRPPLRRISMAPAEATETSQSLSLSQSVSVMQRPRRRRLMGGAMAVILAGGVAVLGYTLGDRVGRPRDTKPVPAAPTGPVAPPLRVLAPPEPPKLPPAPPMPPLPMYDPNAPARPKPPPKRIVHERAAPRLGHGAFLSLEANRVARVFVDGRDTRLLTPVTHVPISPGSHHIRLVAALGGDGTQDFEIHVKRGATAYRYGNLGE